MLLLKRCAVNSRTVVYMLVLDHKNRMIKTCLACTTILLFGIINTITPSAIPSQAQQQESTGPAAIQAHFNQYTGEFTSNGTADTMHPGFSNTKQTALQTSAISQDLNPQVYKDVVVVPVPNGMRSTLVATRNLQDHSIQLHHAGIASYRDPEARQ